MLPCDAFFSSFSSYFLGRAAKRQHRNQRAAAHTLYFPVSDCMIPAYSGRDAPMRGSMVWVNNAMQV